MLLSESVNYKYQKYLDSNKIREIREDFMIEKFQQCIFVKLLKNNKQLIDTVQSIHVDYITIQSC